jgi:quercetin dioxygenase-like cupin family protein
MIGSTAARGGNDRPVVDKGEEGADMRRITWLLAALLAVTACPATAQDAVTVGPTIYKKVLENDRMRVLEGNFKRGAKLGVHSHPDHLLYVLTDGALVFKPGGRTPYEMTFKAGEAFSLPAQTRALENDSDKDIRVLVVELKQPVRTASAPPRGKRVASKGKGKRKARPAAPRKK